MVPTQAINLSKIRMRILIITPAPPSSLAGNRTTAKRWAVVLRSLGHRVSITEDYNQQPTDLVIALHAWRSAKAIFEYKQQHPDHPLIVALTGTDVYKFMRSHPKTTLQSIELADRLVGLHDLVAANIPAAHRSKVTVIYQSAKPGLTREPLKNSFRICVAGHLREEKDPLRPAYAVRSLPTTSRILVDQYGKAHSNTWANRAHKEAKSNQRYRWHGEITQGNLRRRFCHSHLLVLPSRMEGGANVISEAVMAGLPVIASAIDGSIGLLGNKYPGYFEAENTSELREILLRAEKEKSFYNRLFKACEQRRERFTLEREKRSWEKLLARMQ